MDDLVQANLELHEELGKEVRINLENEAKIKRLERQQARYEKDIQYLYSIIEKNNGESQKVCEELHSLRIQLSESHTRLKISEQLCNEKEKFILFRESQLLESEDTIYRLKKQIHKMASPDSSSTPHTTITAGTISTLCGNIRGSLAVFYGDDLPTQEQIRISVDNITNYQGQIESYAGTLEIAYAQAMIECQQAKDDLENKITELANCVEKKDAEKDAYEITMKETREKYESLKGAYMDDIAEYREQLRQAHINLDGAVVELESKDSDINALKDEIDTYIIQCDELDDGLREAEKKLIDMLEISEELEENTTLLANELQQNLDWAKQDIIELGFIITQRNARIENLLDERAILSIRIANCRYERALISAHYRAEQTVNRSLTRQRLALRIANRQLQIRLLNPPVVIPPPILQPPLPNISWLMLH